MSRILVITHFEGKAKALTSLLARLGDGGKNEVIVFYGEKLPCPKKSWLYRTAMRIDTYLFYRNMPQSEYYKTRAVENYPLWIKWGIKLRLFDLISVRNWVGRVKTHNKPDERIVNELRQIKPDWVIGTPLTYWQSHVEGEYIKAAQSLGIKTAGLVLTWDNLTTKNRFYPIPDVVFAWNELHKQELIKYHEVPESKIEVVGSFVFEHWLSAKPFISKKQFCEKYELDPLKPIYCYLGSSLSIAGKDDGVMAKGLIRVYPEAQFILRPHPSNADVFDGMENVLTGKRGNEGQIIREDAIESYLYSEFIYGLNTSAMLEAALVGGKIRIIPGLPETQRDALHFKWLDNFENSKGSMKKLLGFQEKLPSELIKDFIKNVDML